MNLFKHRSVLALLMTALCWSADAQTNQPSDAMVKADYIYKLTSFVDWPAGVFPAADSPFDLCVIGDDPLGPVLDTAVAGQRVNGHPIVVHRLATVDTSPGCELVFVAGSSAQSVKEGLQKLAGTPVLTVTDAAATPGIVDFVVENGRVRFRIDDQAAAQNGLVISSKLLSLAVSVTPRTAEAPH